MRFPLRGPASVALALSLAACGGDGASNPLEPSVGPRFATTSTGKVRISEIHYDNAGTDADERIEITGPAGTDLTGWTLVRYNGSNNLPYTSPAQLDALSGPIPATCGAEGVVVVRFAVDGLQNGAPDGVALVNAAGEVVEFLSYEGQMTAAGGVAAGRTSTNIGTQSGTPIGQSLQATGLGGWAVAPSTFGACNDQPPPPYDGPTTVVISELMGDPLGAESASWGEWFEVHNYGGETVNLAGWTIETAGQPAHTIGGNVLIPAGGYVVLGRGADENRNGNVLLHYNYFTGNSTTIWLDDADWLALRTPGPAVATVDSVKWSSLPQGATRGLRDATADNADVDGANWGFATAATPFGGGDYGTPNAPNAELSATAPAVPTGIVRMVFSGRNVDDVKLPVGFEDQLFVTGYTQGQTDSVKTGFVWSSLTPGLASVDQNGVVHALGVGDAFIRAVAPDGRVGIRRVPTRLATAGPADYVGNTMFGVPTDGNPGDEFVFARAGFTYSYSPARNTPNWVSYDLEATHIGAEDRCDCFTHDPALPSDFARLTTNDYTGAGAAAGYGIDRGHLVRSSDRTAGSLDNAETFYLSNIVPQAADQNQGPWNNLEGFLNTTARTGTSEIYVIAGVAGSKGTLKNEGKVVIPQSTWKIAVVMPRNAGLPQIDAANDFQLIVVDMPNEAGIRNVDWNTYRTTVDAIETKTGYDLLALLPDHVEWLVEAGLSSPVAPAGQLLTVLSGGVQDLVAKGALPHGYGSAILSKLSEAQAFLAAGNTVDAAGAVRALRNQLRAMVRGGQLTQAQVESMDVFAGWVLAAIG